MKISLLAKISPLFLWTWVWAAPLQPVMTLSAALERIQNNPELRRLALSIDAASWRKVEVLSGHLPHLSLNTTHYLAAKYSRLSVNFGSTAVDFPTAFAQTNIELEASILLFDGLGTINFYRAALLAQEAAELDYRHASFKLQETVRIKFFQALAAEQLAQVADQNIKTLEQHLELAQMGERAGIGTRVDVLRIESQLEEAKAEKFLADDNIIIARRALYETLGTTDSAIPLDGSLPVPEEKKLPSPLPFDLASREDLEAQTKRELAQDRVRAASTAFWFPRISVFGTEQFYKFGDFDPAINPSSSFQNAYSFGLRLSWNLFDGGASIARAALADASSKQGAETTRELMIRASNEFETWKRRYLYNAILYRARLRSVEKSQESVRLATIAVKAGAKNHSEVLDAELDLFRARAGVIRAQVAAIEALSQLELAIGHSL